MERFIRRRNIERYRRLLAVTEDESEWRLIADLLAAEEAREAADSGGAAAAALNLNRPG